MSYSRTNYSLLFIIILMKIDNLGAVNIPLFSDEERAQIGTLYKQEGKVSMGK